MDTTQDSGQPVFISQGPFSRLRELQGVLRKASISADIVAPPGANTNA